MANKFLYSDKETKDLNLYDDVDCWDVYKYEHLAHIKSNAKTRKQPFNITVKDFVYPAVCPILGIPLTRKLGRMNYPSLDRIDNNKGYVKGNVRIISYKANQMKREHTQETLERFLKYVKGEI